MELHCTHPTPLATEAQLSSKQEGVCGTVGDKANAVFKNKQTEKSVFCSVPKQLRKKKILKTFKERRNEKVLDFYGKEILSNAFGFGKQAISLDLSQAFSPKLRGLEHSPGLLGGS